MIKVKCLNESGAVQRTAWEEKGEVGVPPPLTRLGRQGQGGWEKTPRAEGLPAVAGDPHPPKPCPGWWPPCQGTQRSVWSGEEREEVTGNAQGAPGTPGGGPCPPPPGPGDTGGPLQACGSWASAHIPVGRVPEPPRTGPRGRGARAGGPGSLLVANGRMGGD